jgi:hypothetical protein
VCLLLVSQRSVSSNEERGKILYEHFAKQSDEVITQFIRVLQQTNNYRAVLVILPLAKDSSHPPELLSMTESFASTENPSNPSQLQETMDQTGKNRSIMTKN